MPDFSTDQTAKPATPETTADQLTFQVGEREYDAESAVTKITAQDAHILKIEQENLDFKAKLEAATLEIASSTSVQDALAQLTATPQESQTTSSTEGMSEEQIGEIASRQLKVLMDAQTVEASERAATAKALSTFESTKSKLEAQFGDKTEAIMKEKAVAMGVPIEHLVKLASDPVTSDLLLTSMQLHKAVTQANPSSSFNTSSLNSSPAPSENPNWYKGSSSDIMAELQRQRQQTL